MTTEALKTIEDQISSLSNQYGPQAWDTVCLLKKVEALSAIALGGICLSIIIGIICLGRRWIKDKTLENCDIEAPFVFVSSLLLSVLGLVAVVNLLNIWNWVGLINPQLAISHDILSKVLGN